MKILHTSDLHLGISLCGKSLISYQKEIIDSICFIAKEQNAGAVIIAGDIYDRAVAGAEAISLYDRLITRLCLELKIKVIICAGNHDGAERLSAGKKLLKTAGLYVFGRAEKELLPIEFDDCDIYVMPYTNREEIRGALSLEAGTSLNGAVKALVDTAKLNGNKKNILAAHLLVLGGEASESDTAAKIGGADAIDASVFSEFDYVALGHLHRAQKVAGNIRYSGTPMPYSFGEARYEKSAVLLDTETMEEKLIPIPQPVIIRELTGSFEELLEEAKKSPSEDLIKITLTDRFSGQGLRDELSEFYPNILYFAGKPDEMGALIPAESLKEKSPEELASMYYEFMTGEAIPEKFTERFRLALSLAIKEDLQ